MPADAEVDLVDGRRARRERGRLAVLDAMIDLLQSGDDLPSTEAVADRAGVSVASVFRYFDSLDDLRHQTALHFFERYASLFEVPDLGTGDLPDRVRRFVGARAELYDAIAPVSRLVRIRAGEHQDLADVLAGTRRRLAAQVRVHFEPELAALGRDDRDDRVALISTLTAFEAWDQLHSGLARSHDEILRAWTTGVLAIWAYETGRVSG